MLLVSVHSSLVSVEMIARDVTVTSCWAVPAILPNTHPPLLIVFGCLGVEGS
eukprot:m.496826 g.496826  ORF g.496826 m.496826 type:complete len:52 (-) comp49034_c0_seq1:6-161(-)